MLRAEAIKQRTTITAARLRKNEMAEHNATAELKSIEDVLDAIGREVEAEMLVPGGVRFPSAPAQGRIIDADWQEP